MKHTLALTGLIFAGIATSPTLATADSAGNADMTVSLPQPRLAVGVSYGQLSVDSGHEGRSLSIQGQLRLGQLSLVGEIGKDEIDDLSRTDRRVGGSVHWRLTRGLFVPYVRAGGGIVRSEALSGALVYDDFFGEIGGGAAFRLAPRVSITADIVFGKRDRLRTVNALTIRIYMPQNTRYTRIGAGLLIAL